MATATNQNRPETFPQKAERSALARWKLETLTGILGIESLQKQTEMSHANQEAENRWARERVWGQSPDTNPTGPKDDGEATDNDMQRGHILGDVNHTYPAPVVYPPQPPQSNALPLVATVLGALGVPGAAILGYALANRPAAVPTPTPQPQQYEQIELGLGRLEDFIQQGTRQ